MKEGLARADQEDVPCFLETSNERNVAFYERFGFAIAETTTLGRGGPKAWACGEIARAAPAMIG